MENMKFRIYGDINLAKFVQDSLIKLGYKRLFNDFEDLDKRNIKIGFIYSHDNGLISWDCEDFAEKNPQGSTKRYSTDRVFSFDFSLTSLDELVQMVQKATTVPYLKVDSLDHKIVKIGYGLEIGRQKITAEDTIKIRDFLNENFGGK